jgi:hypothetical protein
VYHGVFNCTQGTTIVLGHFGSTNFLIDSLAIAVNDHMSAGNKSQVFTLLSKILLLLVSRLARPRVICLNIQFILQPRALPGRNFPLMITSYSAAESGWDLIGAVTSKPHDKTDI